MQGVFEATKELGQPFISEAIWTEAATDIIVRGGRTRDGRRLYTEQTPNGERAMAIVGHLVDSQLPGSIEQFKRFDLAIEPVDIIQRGKFDKYGRQYELSDELLGIVGLRAVEVNPVNSMKFKIADYTRGISNARREFTTPLLRGGAVTPEQIVDRYQVANNQAYKVQQEMFRDYYAARTLGAKEGALDLEFADRVSRVSLAAIKGGRYKPFIPSENIIESFGENARKIGQRNPYLSAKPVIDRIARQYNNLPLVLENFPIIPNPFSVTQTNLPTAGIGASLPNLGLSSSMPTGGIGANQNTVAKGQLVFGSMDPVFGEVNERHSKGIEPEDDREHIISLYGHVKGVEREIELIKTNHLKHLDDKITHVHSDVEKLGRKIDKIYWVVLTTVGAVGLIFIETLLGMI